MHLRDKVMQGDVDGRYRHHRCATPIVPDGSAHQLKVAAILGGRFPQDESGQPGADKGAGGVRGIACLAPAGEAAIGAYLDKQRVPLREQVERVSHRLG
jgi:hypothetical protein